MPGKRTKKTTRRKGGRNAQNQFLRRPKVCIFSKEGGPEIDYKDVTLLKQFISETGHIIPSRMTGTRAKPQRRLTRAIKRAQFLALLPYTDRHSL